MASDPFVVHVARLRKNLGGSLHEMRRGPVVLAGPLDELGIDPGRSVGAARGRGRRSTSPCGPSAGHRRRRHRKRPWVGICRRCTAPVTGELRIAVRERFGDAPIAEDELYPITDCTIASAPLVPTPSCSS